jgi:SAM-dependent methyltransferase
MLDSPAVRTAAQAHPAHTRDVAAGVAPTPIPRRPSHRDLFLISFTILFLELACIRWFASTVVFLTFFTNLVLLASFLGMSVGCLAATRQRDYARAVLPLALVAVGLSAASLWAYTTYGKIIVNVGGTTAPEQVYFGTDSRPRDPSQFLVPIELVAGVFFALVALAFVGLGQALGRTLGAIPNRIAAYTTNVLGSVAGIAGFGALCLARTPPVVWFGVAVGLVLRILSRRSGFQFACALGLVVTVALLGHWEGQRWNVSWSPYYKINFRAHVANPTVSGAIQTNNIGHQTFGPLGQAGLPYVLPHLLNRDSGGEPFRDVLIIGAGSGNDVQAALVHGARQIDAVEIDRDLAKLGKVHHPDGPYHNRRVRLHYDDGRSFVRNTNAKYDLIVYALVDSLVLHSGYSSLRLESFLFTKEAFRDIKARLKPGGVFALYNYYRQGWVVGRLDRLASDVFGGRPLALTLPYREVVAPEESKRGLITCLLAGDATALERYRAMFSSSRFFWANERSKRNVGVNGFGLEPPTVAGTKATSWKQVGPAHIEMGKKVETPSDNWPFLYLRSGSIPSLNLRGMAIVAAISLAILVAFAPVRTARPSGPMFFLGAGFMLLETKGVVHMALLFGSTWAVNSIVFMAVLAMILLSNLFVLAIRPRRRWPFLVGLLVALGFNLAVPTARFLALPGTLRLVASCAVTFVPIFFAGVLFATALRDSRRPDVDLGSNIAGAILGGLSENLALVVGFDALLAVAAVFYLLAEVSRSAGRAGSLAAPAG